MVVDNRSRLEAVISSLAIDEPFYVLRAKDSCAADTVENHAIRMKVAGRDNDMIRAAYQIAEDMRQWRSDNYDRSTPSRQTGTRKKDSVHAGDDRADEEGGSE